MSWFNGLCGPKEDTEPFTARRAKQMAFNHNNKRRNDRNAFLIRQIKEVAELGVMYTTWEGEDFYQYYPDKEIPFKSLLHANDIEFLQSLGYQVTRQLRDIQFRIGTYPDNMKFEVKKCEYYKVSWE